MSRLLSALTGRPNGGHAARRLESGRGREPAAVGSAGVGDPARRRSAHAERRGAASARSGLGEHVLDLLRPRAHAARPAVLRIAAHGYSAAHNLRRRRMMRALHRQDASRFAPVGVVRVLRAPLPPRIADLLFDAAQVANLLAALGVAHRVTGPLNAALQLWTLAYRNSWGMVLHNDNMLVLHQAVLGATRSADALSVDALLRDGALLPRREGREYGAVATAMNLATTSVYLISGVAKVRSPKGFGWASGDVLREQIAADAVRKERFGVEAPRLAGALYRSRAQFGVLAAGALAIELGAPISLLHRGAGRLFALAAWSMHAGIRAIMGIKFPYNVSGLSYLPYFPVERPLVRGS
ncbi:hypothetical protein [Gulosibacter sp. 10]|uniref:hypothetical protein n=1 Tax=Gulosibacter sp. 10 TaxID=1255570 RepID=UPI00097ED70A|nr:hypothetical protein [Gulosibacter sp. 10]SJM64175.1 hypothetical protein FM112_09895 [Gulosibacter sp. 10]